MIRAIVRSVYYLAIAAFLALFIWSQSTARTWQEIAGEAQNVAVETAQRADACFSELYKANRDKEKKEKSQPPFRSERESAPPLGLTE